MNNTKGILLSSAMLAALFFFSACGESDSGTASAPAPAPPAAAAPETAAEPAAPAEESEAFDISTVEKAEGVVYQDEIYAGWPYN